MLPDSSVTHVPDCSLQQAYGRPRLRRRHDAAVAESGNQLNWAEGRRTGPRVMERSCIAPNQPDSAVGSAASFASAPNQCQIRSLDSNHESRDM